jgi:hypothetical protein
MVRGQREEEAGTVNTEELQEAMRVRCSSERPRAPNQQRNETSLCSWLFAMNGITLQLPNQATAV